MEEEFMEVYGFDKKMLPLKKYQLIGLLLIKEHLDDEEQLEDEVLQYFIDNHSQFELDEHKIKKIKKLFQL